MVGLDLCGGFLVKGAVKVGGKVVGKVAAKVLGKGASTAGAAVIETAAVSAVAKPPNRIYSARELIRRAVEIGPFHNFPESFNRQIF